MRRSLSRFDIRKRQQGSSSNNDYIQTKIEMAKIISFTYLYLRLIGTGISITR